MICKKCGKELPEESLFCNFCGEKVVDDEVSDQTENLNPEPVQEQEEFADVSQIGTESLEPPTPLAKKSKKKIIIISIAVILVIALVGGGIGYSNYQNKQKEQQVQQAKTLYAQNFTTTTVDVLLETYSCGVMCDTLSTTWSDAIKSGYSDFNTELANKIKGWQDDGTIQKRADAKAKLEESMKKLQNPVDGYAESHNLLVDLYATYTQIYSQATSPQGSLTTYNADINTKMSDFNKQYEKLKVLQPEIATALQNKKS